MRLLRHKGRGESALHDISPVLRDGVVPMLACRGGHKCSCYLLKQQAASETFLAEVVTDVLDLSSDDRDDLSWVVSVLLDFQNWCCISLFS